MDITAKFRVVEVRAICGEVYPSVNGEPDYDAEPELTYTYKVALNPLKTNADLANKLLWGAVPNGRVELDSVNPETFALFPIGGIVTQTLTIAGK
jgi:hypothetical protein